MKLKVGDKVKVRRWEDLEHEYPPYPLGGIRVTKANLFLPKMRSFCGRIVTISDVFHPPHKTFYEIQEDYGAFEWVQEMFEADTDDKPILYSEVSSKDEQVEEIADCVLGGSTEYRLDVAERVYAKGFRKQSQWVSVDEALPEMYKDVLCFNGHSVGVDFICSDGTWCEGKIHDKPITHWMPLPETPKMKGCE